MVVEVVVGAGDVVVIVETEVGVTTATAAGSNNIGLAVKAKNRLSV